MSVIDPYRILFPIGIVFGLWGASLWVFFWLGALVIYPSQNHADIMTNGFMFSFVGGFLMTATPKYLGTYKAQLWEIVSMFVIMVGLLITGIIENRMFFHLLALIGNTLLTVFVYQRFFERQNHLYPFYIFVLVGLLLGVLGCLLILFIDVLPVMSGFLSIAKVLFREGLVLSLIVGVGSTLIPTVLGYGNPNVIQITSSSLSLNRTFFRTISPQIWWLLFGFVSSFIIEMWSPFMGRSLRAAMVTIILGYNWKLYRLPITKSKLSYSLWISGWILIIGLWIYGLFPTYAVHGIHVAYIGGFSFMSLLIASRVVLAHGFHGFYLETKSNLLYYIGILLIISAFTRYLSVFMPNLYFSHLAYAAVVWISALLIWGGVFIKKIIKLNQHIAPAHDF